ncbi:MAG: DNA polymerase III subunit beta, partial [Sphingobacteriia bacterium]|nr:DNA polymerase III subunit beta [Sphingobacteriia bacterium]
MESSLISFLLAKVRAFRHKIYSCYMKFSIEKNVFINGLQQVINIVAQKSVMPILSNVLLVAEDGKITLTATNLDITIRCTVRANVSESGRITLPAKKLLTIIRALPQQNVIVEESQNRVNITSGNSVFDISGMAADDFPSTNEVSIANENNMIFKQSDMANILKNVSYAQSHDDNRYILNGVFFCFDEDKINFVATDGRRLSIVYNNLPNNKIKHNGVIVPSKTINEIERLLGQGNNISVSFNDKQILFYIDVDTEDQKSGFIDNIFILSKVVEGNYPNFKQVVPKEAKNRIKIDRQLLLETLQRVSLVTSDQKNSIRLRFAPNTVEIFASSPEYGEARESIAIAYNGPKIEIAFNPIFLCDPLK